MHDVAVVAEDRRSWVKASRVPVSVLLPVYNGGELAARALASLLYQSVAADEIIVIDDASTDGSLDGVRRVAKPFDHVRIIVHRHNAGLSNTLNEGLSLARHDWILRSDQDDYSHPCRLERLWQVALGQETADLIGSFVSLEMNKARVLAPDDVRQFFEFEDYRRSHAGRTRPLDRDVLRRNVFHHPELLMRRQPVVEAGGYRPQFCHSEDYDLWLRLAGRTTFHIVEETLYTRSFYVKDDYADYYTLQGHGARLALDCADRRAAGEDDEEYSKKAALAFPMSDAARATLRRHMDSAERYRIVGQASESNVGARGTS